MLENTTKGYCDYVRRYFRKMGFTDDNDIFYDDIPQDDVDYLLDLADDMEVECFISIELSSEPYHLIFEGDDLDE